MRRFQKFAVAVIAMAVALAAGASTSGAQQPRALSPLLGTASLSGTVIDASNSKLAGVRVTLAGSTADPYRPTRETLTDGNGAFSFPQVPADTYQITASLPGWLPGRYGQRKPDRGGSPVVVADRQAIGGLAIHLFRGAVLTGTITGQSGLPVVNGEVQSFRLRYSADGRYLDRVGDGKTDDRGQYRIFGLSPGDYLVRALPPFDDVRAISDPALDGIQTAPASGYARIFFPGVPSPSQASTIALAVGEERAGIDFLLSQVPLGHIRGHVVGPNGPVTNVQFWAVDDDGLLRNGDRLNAAQSADGTFVISNVPPGMVSILARAYPANRPGQVDSGSMSSGTLWGTARVSVTERDVSDLTLAMQPGVTMSGQILLDGKPVAEGAAFNPGSSIAVFPAGATPLQEGEVLAGSIGPGGRFSIGGVPPGAYHLLTIGGGASRFIESVMHEGRDVTFSGVEVTGNNVGGVTISFTEHPASLSGTIHAPAETGMGDYTIIAFPADPAVRANRAAAVYTARPSSGGRFVIPNVMPGEYLIALTDDVEPNSWFDPRIQEFLATRGLRVTIAASEAKVQDLTIGPGRSGGSAR